MNLIGHNYVAYRVLDRLNSYTAYGSHLPDLVPFTPGSVLSYTEIHEGTRKLHRYIKRKYPEKRDLALAMMAHSVEFGADQYNRKIREWLIGENDNIEIDIARHISDCSHISLSVAKGPRLHNYLWCGIDYYLIKKEKEFVRNLYNIYKTSNINEVAELLGEFYEKDKNEILKNLKYHFSPVTNNDITTEKGFVNFWKFFLSGLPEKDKVDVEKTDKLINFIYDTFYNEWQEIIEKTIKNVHRNMRRYL
jgi:hypothetical protein